MEIILAKDMGFCWGVKRAIDMMERAAAEKGPMQSLGPIVHNNQAVARLAERGVQMIQTIDELNDLPVAITAHGTGPTVINDLKTLGKEIVDTTCPIVTRAQRWAKKLVDNGFAVIIFGDAEHREVKGTIQWTNGKAIAITEAGIDSLPKDMPSRIGVMSQTTQNPQRFAAFVTKLLQSRIDRISEFRMVNTLCHVTSGQQEAARELARDVDIMIVVGGRHSANTRHLAEVSEEEGVETHHIETADELLPEWFAGKERVGVTAGASTPDFVIDEVVERLRSLNGAGLSQPLHASSNQSGQ